MEAKRRGLQTIEPKFEMKDILSLNSLKPNVGKKKFLDFDEIENVLIKLKKDGKKIGFCSGCFDILQSGHAVFFSQCKELCDILFVSVGKDSVIRKLKGEGRPINSENNRAYLLGAMSEVDYVILGGNEILPGKIDFYNNLKKIKPDVFILNDNDSAIEEKRRACQEVGAELKLVKRNVPSFLNHTSSSVIIEELNNK